MKMEEDDQKQIEQITTQLKEVFTDDAFAVYRKMIMIRQAGEHMYVYANKIRQLVGLAGFKGNGLKTVTKLTFVTGFPDTISIRLQQAPNVKALTIGDLISRARVPTTTEEQKQDLVAAMCSPNSCAKSSPRTNVICCNVKGHFEKDC